MSGTVGTLAWAEATGGRLRWRDRLALLRQAVGFQLRVIPRQIRWKLGFQAALPEGFDVAAVEPPDSAAARDAVERCREVSSESLANHCLRTWLFGRAFGAVAKMDVDDEALFVAAMLHDLGLTSRWSGEGSADAPPCFTVRGSRGVAELAARQGWDDARRDTVAEAITLHLNPRVDAGEHGAVAHLLNAGAALDVAGIRAWDVHRDLLAGVVARFPRLGMKAKIWETWSAESQRHPACRAAFLNRWASFRRRIRKAPFEE